MKSIIAIMFIGLCLQSCVRAPQRSLQEKISQKSLVVTISSMAELESFVDDDSLVLFDLDHTVFEAAQTYGHLNWFYGNIKADKDRGISEKDSIMRIFPGWLQSQERASVTPVEALTPKLISKLQARGLKVMGLTARQTSLASSTLRQLSEINIDFSKSSLAPAVFEHSEFAAPALFKNGVLFASEFVKKSEVLIAYFTRIGYWPRRVVFVDDVLKNAEDLVEASNKMSIEVIALHYPYVKKRNTSWDQARADMIFERCNNEADWQQDVLCQESFR